MNKNVEILKNSEYNIKDEVKNAENKKKSYKYFSW